jgi:3-methyladenine DNA glycosylase Tag
MRHFDELLAIASERQGGLDALEQQIPVPKSAAELSKIPDDRWLSDITKNVFRAGFNRNIINDKWPHFEKAFAGFNPQRCAMMDDDWFDALLKNVNIVRNAKRIRSVQHNAMFVLDQSAKHGSFGAFLAGWEPEAFAELMEFLRSRGSRIGDKTAQYMLREAGVDGYILSFDVVKRLSLEGIADKVPTSRTRRLKIQAAFDQWREQSGKSLTYISRVLAMSVESDHQYRFG